LLRKRGDRKACEAIEGNEVRRLIQASVATHAMGHHGAVKREDQGGEERKSRNSHQ